MNALRARKSEAELALIRRAAEITSAAFVELMHGLEEKAVAGMGPASLADELLEKTGYLSALRDADSAEAE